MRKKEEGEEGGMTGGAGVLGRERESWVGWRGGLGHAGGMGRGEKNGKWAEENGRFGPKGNRDYNLVFYFQK